MSGHGLFAQVSGVVVALLAVAAVLAFVLVDVVRLAGRRTDPAWVRRAAALAWPLGIVAVVLAVARVLVLA